MGVVGGRHCSQRHGWWKQRWRHEPSRREGSRRRQMGELRVGFYAGNICWIRVRCVDLIVVEVVGWVLGFVVFVGVGRAVASYCRFVRSVCFDLFVAVVAFGGITETMYPRAMHCPLGATGEFILIVF